MDLRREYENTRGEREREKWKRMWREQVGGQALFYFNGAVSRPEPPLALRSSSQLLGFDVAIYIYIYIHFFIHVLLPRFPSLSVIPRYRNFSNLLNFFSKDEISRWIHSRRLTPFKNSSYLLTRHGLYTDSIPKL